MADRQEFRIVSGMAPDDLTRALAELSAEGWAVSAFTVAPGAGYAALVARKPRPRTTDDDQGAAATDG